MKKSVFGILRTRQEAEAVVDRLKSAGFSSNDISILFPDTAGSRDFAHEHATKAPEGATTGGTSGFVVGGVLGWLAGIGSLAIPGLGPFIAAGPIMAALSGAAVGAAVGGIAGALIGMGIPEYEAKRYESKIKEGNILVSVHAEDGNEVDRAKDILKDAHAEDVATSGEASVPGETRAEREGERAAASMRTTSVPGETRSERVTESTTTTGPTRTTPERTSEPIRTTIRPGEEGPRDVIP